MYLVIDTDCSWFPVLELELGSNDALVPGELAYNGILEVPIGPHVDFPQRWVGFHDPASFISQVHEKGASPSPRW